MYELTKRLIKLNTRLHEIDFVTPAKWYFEDINILDIEGNEFLSKEPIVIRKAYAIRYVVEHLPVLIKNDEIIVGCPNENSVEFGICIPQYLTEDERSFFARYNLSEVSISGHHPPSYDKIIKCGIIGIRQEIEENLGREIEKNFPNGDLVDEYRAMLLSLEALGVYANRYAEEALKFALTCTDKKRQEELFNIYKVCKQVPLHPANTLQEAVQSYWFTYTVLNSVGEFLPLSRIDQYFYMYYVSDLQNGKISDEEALDIIGNFLIKCNEKVTLDPKKITNHKKFGFMESAYSLLSKDKIIQRKLELEEHAWHFDENENSDNNFSFGQEANNRMMTCVVGGVKLDGSDATNELSYIIIKLVYEMKLLMPTLGARIHAKTPRSFIELLATVLRHNQGEPIIYNDTSIIQSYEKMGITAKEARDYSSDGCWETLLPGKSNFVYKLVPCLQCLEWVLNRGIHLKENVRASIDTGDPLQFENFDEFYKAYKIQLYRNMEWRYELFLKDLGVVGLVAPDPLLSVIMDDCILKGKDVYDNGAKYDFKMLIASGLADTVDSLNVIKILVYEEKKISLGELNNALHCNWNGYERLRAFIINKIEKFGNDDDDTDKMAERILDDFAKKIIELRKRSEKIKLTAGIGTFHIYGLLGRDASASANGRYNYDPLAPNYSPVPGCDKNGPTSVIKSITKPNLSDFFSGTPVDIAVNKNEFEGDAGIRRLSDLILSFCDMGGQILSITSNSVEELLDAKIHPEKHKNLRVRMGGLSAYFITLAPIQQDNIIKRFNR